MFLHQLNTVTFSEKLCIKIKFLDSSLKEHNRLSKIICIKMKINVYKKIWATFPTVNNIIIAPFLNSESNYPNCWKQTSNQCIYTRNNRIISRKNHRAEFPTLKNIITAPFLHSYPKYWKQASISFHPIPCKRKSSKKKNKTRREESWMN